MTDSNNNATSLISIESLVKSHDDRLATLTKELKIQK